MKKIFSLAAIALFMLTSCSSDDDSSPVDNPGSGAILLKKTIAADQDGNELTTDYAYDGNKLTNVTDSEGFKMNLFYENDLLVKIEYFENNILNQRDVYTYDANNRLATVIMMDLDEDWASKMLFTHNSNGTVSIEDYTGDLLEQTTLYGNGMVTYNNSNIVDYTVTTTGGSEVNRVYTFDSKNNPLKNIVSFDTFNLAYQEGGSNNTLSYTNEAYDEASTTEYTYNSDNYPTTSVETDNNGTITTTQYFYE